MLLLPKGVMVSSHGYCVRCFAPQSEKTFNLLVDLKAEHPDRVYGTTGRVIDMNVSVGPVLLACRALHPIGQPVEKGLGI